MNTKSLWLLLVGGVHNISNRFTNMSLSFFSVHVSKDLSANMSVHATIVLCLSWQWAMHNKCIHVHVHVALYLLAILSQNMFASGALCSAAMAWDMLLNCPMEGPFSHE